MEIEPVRKRPGAPGLVSETWEGATTENSKEGLLRPSFIRSFYIVLSVSLILSTLLALLWSIRWPLVGDASLIHYIAFLIERGWAPYRDLGDMNMPGSFLIELAAMHLFGMGDLAWRLFDFTLLAAASVSIFAILSTKLGAPFMEVSSPWAGPKPSRIAALFASCLFALVHIRDGLAQGGQRDLTMAVCLLAATAFLLHTIRRLTAFNEAHKRPQTVSTFAFGLLSGIAFTIKPTTALFTLAQLTLAAYLVYKHRTLGSPERTRFTPALLAAALGYATPIATCLLFLLREHALAAFLSGLHGIVPYYASLGHRPLGYILNHSVSPIVSLVILWLLVLALGGSSKCESTEMPKSFGGSQSIDPTRSLLLLGTLFGLINCILQARALPYYRYPLLAFLLPLIALDLTTVIQTPRSTNSPIATLRSQALQLLALAALVVGSLFLAPQSAILIHRYRWQQTDLLTSLEDNLNRLGGPRLSNHIQCIDSVSGCGTALYRMRLEPSTGILSDFLLFGAVTDGPATPPIVRDTRAQLIAALAASPPQVLVVTSHLHIDGPDDYRKLDRWPAFQDILAANYTLATEWTPTRTNRWWSREELPAGYRIYLLRNPALAGELTR